MAKSPKQADGAADEPPLRDQIVFRLREDVAALLQDWERGQEVKPNISALVNVALYAYLKSKQERDERKGKN